MGSPVRRQYYFEPSNRGLLAWDVDRLVRLTENLPRKQVPFSNIPELDERWNSEDEPPTWRVLIEHMALIDDADLSFPFISSSNGDIIDGMHGVARAVQEEGPPLLMGRPPNQRLQLTRARWCWQPRRAPAAEARFVSFLS